MNCVTPAAAKTEMFEQMKQEHIDYMLSKIPMNRFLEVEELAAMIAWLCVGGLLVLDRGGVRYFGRPGGVLRGFAAACARLR